MTDEKEIKCENECGGAFKGSDACIGCVYRKEKQNES
jgi:hypothetical protein